MGEDAADPGPPVEPGFLEEIFRSTRANAILAWLVVAAIPLALLESVLDGDLQWITFLILLAVIVVLPPASARNWRVMLPWELLVLGLLPILVRTVVGGELGTFATYLSVAGLALIVTVELHVFTALDLTHWFAVALVVLATMASVAVWTMVRWSFDQQLGSTYLSTNEALMAEWFWVSLAGVAGGVLFDTYFRRRDRQLRRIMGRRGGP